MSAPETDPFYDALRNRLHDYEEPLPAGGWAGIAQKLPPPKPWWRRRPPRRLLLLTLLLLLIPAALLWRWQAQRSPAAQAPALASSPAAPAARGAAASTNRASADNPAAGTSAGPAVAQATTADEATTASGTDNPTSGAASGGSSTTATSRAVPGRTVKIRSLGHVQHLPPGTVGGLPGDSTHAAASPDAKTPPLTTARRRQRKLLLVAADPRRRPLRSYSKPHATDAPAAHPAAPRPAAPAQPAALASQQGAPAASQTAAQPGGQTAPSEFNPPSTGAGAVAPTVPGSAASTAPGGVSALGANEPAATPGLPGAPTRKRTPKARYAPSAAEAAGSTAQPLTSGAPGNANVSVPGETDPAFARLRANDLLLGSLTSALLLPPGAVLPTPLPPPAGPRDSLRRLRPARLSLGLLLGSLLPPPALAVRPDSAGRKLPLGRLPGVSAELAARYRLSPTLALRGGVGYLQQRQEASVTVEKRQPYWGRTTQIVVTNTPTGPDTLRLISYGLLDSVVSRQRQRFRPSQQYLTLPLAAEWHPRTPFVRWQPVLGFGATASWLLRGSYLTSQDGCHCEEKTQRGGAAGPFAPVSVALTASLGLDYALGLRSVLLVRPAATYSLGSPTRNGGRGTLSAGLQVGWLFDAHRP